MKYALRQKAMRLRKKGKSYGEIQKTVNVSQSTLSLWLRDVKLTNLQKERLLQKKLLEAFKGSQLRRRDRVKREQMLIKKHKQEIKKLTHHERLLIGTILYWAEGAKQKKHNVSARVSFSNSDPNIIKIFIDWLDIICNIKHESLVYELYIHENSEIKKAYRYWINFLDIEGSLKVRLKRHKTPNFRKNVGPDYRGLIKITVRKSTSLNRQIKGWTHGIIENWGVV